MTEDYSEFVKIMPASQPALFSEHGLRVLSMVVRSQNCPQYSKVGFLRIQRWKRKDSAGVSQFASSNANSTRL